MTLANNLSSIFRDASPTKTNQIKIELNNLFISNPAEMKNKYKPNYNVISLAAAEGKYGKALYKGTLGLMGDLLGYRGHTGRGVLKLIPFIHIIQGKQMDNPFLDQLKESHLKSIGTIIDNKLTFWKSVGRTSLGMSYSLVSSKIDREAGFLLVEAFQRVLKEKAEAERTTLLNSLAEFMESHGKGKTGLKEVYAGIVHLLNNNSKLIAEIEKEIKTPTIIEDSKKASNSLMLS